jgi:small subunit ribosomal protein S17
MADDKPSAEAEDATVEEPVAAEVPAEEVVTEEAVTEEPAAAEAPAEEEVTEEPAAAEAPAEEAVTEEPVVAEAPAEEAAAEDAEDAAAPAAVTEEPAAAPPEEVLSSKERRRRTRQRSSTGAAAARTPEERRAERDELRTKAAKARRERRIKVRGRKPAAQPAAASEAESPSRGSQKTRQGIVISDKADKTITVRIDISRRHRRYEKIVRTSKSLHAHDEDNEAHEGDLVRVIETRPLSRTKRWRLDQVLERAR